METVGMDTAGNGGLNGKPLKKVKRIYDDPVEVVSIRFSDDRRVDMSIVVTDAVPFVGMRIWKYDGRLDKWYPSFKNGMFIRLELAIEMLPALSKLITKYQSKNQVIKSGG